MKMIRTAIMATVLVAMTACGSNQQQSAGRENGSTEHETPVDPPSVDIHAAAFLGDLEAIRQHIKAGSDLDAREPTMNSTPLISAAVLGKTEVARALIAAGGDVNLQNNDGSTALHSAAFLCRTEIVEMLLANGADKSLKNIYGSTALESVAGPFESVKPIYDEFSKNLGPLGLKLDYRQLEETRPVIAGMLR